MSEKVKEKLEQLKIDRAGIEAQIKMCEELLSLRYQEDPNQRLRRNYPLENLQRELAQPNPYQIGLFRKRKKGYRKPRPRPLETEVLAVLSDYPMTCEDITPLTGSSYNSVSGALNRLTREEKVKRHKMRGGRNKKLVWHYTKKESE